MPVPLSGDDWREHWAIERGKFLASPRNEFRSFWRWYGRYKSRDLLSILNLYLECGEMARGTKKPATNAAVRNQWTEFVDIPLAEDDFEQIGKTFPDADAVDEAVVELLEKGYRLSLSYNPGNDAFICSVTCKDTESPNNGKTFNAFAGSWTEAIQCALYKHFVKVNRVWGAAADKPSRPRFG